MTRGGPPYAHAGAKYGVTCRIFTAWSGLHRTIDQTAVTRERDGAVGLPLDVLAAPRAHLLEVELAVVARRESRRRAARADPGGIVDAAAASSTSRAVSLSASAATITGRPAARMP